MTTSGLVIDVPADESSGRIGWSAKNLAVSLQGNVDATTGRTHADVSVRDGSDLLRASASAVLDFQALLEKRFSALQNSEIEATFSMPRRTFASLAWLPGAQSLGAIGGGLRVDGNVDGKLGKPILVARATADGLTAAAQPGQQATAWSVPLNLETVATYDGEHGTLQAFATQGTAKIATISAAVDARARDMFGEAKTVPWKGRVHADVTGLPMRNVYFLADRGFDGTLVGKLDAERSPEKSTMHLDLESPSLRVGDAVKFDRARATLDVRPRSLAPGDVVDAAISLGVDHGGELSLMGSAPVNWVHGVLPLPSAPTSAQLSAKAFRLASMSAFTPATVSKLDGLLDGTLRYRAATATTRGGLEGALAVTSATVDIPFLGQELRDASMRIDADPEKGVDLHELEAHGASGVLTGSAHVDLDGIEPKSATGQLSIPAGRELPIAFEGMPIGMISGGLSFEAKPDDHGGVKVVVVTLPPVTSTTGLYVELATASGRATQSLDEREDVRTSHPIARPTSHLTGGSLPVQIELRFDEDGSVRVAQRAPGDLDMTFTSKSSAPLLLELGNDASGTGEISIPRGRFQVLGKRFEIESGTIKLRPENVGNPLVAVTARWASPEGTQVFVDYVGELLPITGDKLTFRSSPPLAEKDVIALLGGLSGSTGANAGSPTPTQALLGSALADQLNGLIHGISALRRVSTGIVPTAEGALRTSVSYQVSDSVTASASYQQESAPTTSTLQGAGVGVCISDRPGAACTEMSVDWRFLRNWSLRGTVGGVSGQTNSALDMLWRKRY